MHINSKHCNEVSPVNAHANSMKGARNIGTFYKCNPLYEQGQLNIFAILCGDTFEVFISINQLDINLV